MGPSYLIPGLLTTLLLSSLVAGCAAPRADDDAVVSADAPAGPTVVQGTKFSFEGQTPLAVCVLIIVQECVVHMTEPLPGVTLADEVPGTPVRVYGEMTWEADTPLTEKARLYLQGRNTSSSPIIAEIHAASPIVFDWDLATIGGTHHRLVMHAFTDTYAGPGRVLIEPPQDLRVAGTIDWIPPAD